MDMTIRHFNRKCSRLTRALLALVFAGVLAACGSGGGEREFDSDSSSSGGSSTAVAKVELIKSSPSISSDGRQVVRLYATVKTDGNVAIPGVAVVFSASGSGVTIAASQTTTDANGQVEASMSVSDPSNRTIEVSANADGQSASTTVSVVGTTTAISGPGTIAIGTATPFKVVVKDASGAPVVGKEVSVSSAGGSTVSVSPQVTDEQGAVTATVTSSAAGADTLTASSAGAVGMMPINVASKSISFVTPQPATEVVVAQQKGVAVNVQDSGSPLASARVSLSATRGTFNPAVTDTGADGVATTNIISPYAGRSIMTATTTGGILTSQEILFVGGPTHKLELQAWPTSLGVTLPGSTPESSQVIAIVRDRTDNPVKGVRVDFSVTDPSNGLGLSENYAISDEFGRATVSFYPGSVPTGANQIFVTARTIRCTDVTIGGVTRDLTRDECSSYSLEQAAFPTLADQAQLTAGRRALQVRIGTGNELDKVDALFNEVPYGVLVTDSAGNPVPSVTLSATVISLDYRAGDWVYVGPCTGDDPCWIFDGENCAGEDVNRNLRLDAGEDRNLDGVLTPGSVAAAYFGQSGLAASGTTDQFGSAVLRIRYPRDRSYRANVSLRVNASVPDGTEGTVSTTFWLPMLAEDIVGVESPPGKSGAAVGYGSTCP